MFRFKKFTVHDEACAMKVGTDGTLLGAWAPLYPSKQPAGQPHVLDVGTGSGLIALMLAQRDPQARILAIDIDEPSVRQAADNFAASPWPERLEARHCSLQDLAAEPDRAHSFQLVVSNPPFFVDSLKNPDAARAKARHTDFLPFDQLVSHCTQLLAEDGILALIVPAEAEPMILSLAAKHGLTPYLITRVHTRPHKPAKRTLLALYWANKAKLPNLPNLSSLFLQTEDGAPRSADYQKLCQDFYL